MGKTLREGGRETERKALQAIQEMILRYGDQSKVLPTKWRGGEYDILTAVHTRFGEHLDTCMGEYFFKPVDGDPDGGRYFCTVITLRNDIPSDVIPELAYALGFLNFYIENGCFAMNLPADLLVFKNVRNFAGDTPEEAAVSDCLRLAQEAYEVAAKYCTPLLAMAEGSLGLAEFMKMLQPNV